MLQNETILLTLVGGPDQQHLLGWIWRFYSSWDSMVAICVELLCFLEKVDAEKELQACSHHTSRLLHLKAEGRPCSCSIPIQFLVASAINNRNKCLWDTTYGIITLYHLFSSIEIVSKFLRNSWHCKRIFDFLLWKPGKKTAGKMIYLLSSCSYDVLLPCPGFWCF